MSFLPARELGPAPRRIRHRTDACDTPQRTGQFLSAGSHEGLRQVGHCRDGYLARAIRAVSYNGGVRMDRDLLAFVGGFLLTIALIFGVVNIIARYDCAGFE